MHRLKLLLFFIPLSISAQKTLVSNSGLNLLYAGISNNLFVVNEKTERRHLKVVCTDFRVIDSNGVFFLPILKNCLLKETRIIVSDKRRGKKSWHDTLYFRIKKLPKVEVQMGSLYGNDDYTFQELLSSRFFYAYMSNFYFDGIKYSVISYDYHIIRADDFSQVHGHLDGNKSIEFINILTLLSDKNSR